MATLTVRFQNSERQPLDDTIDFDVTDHQTGVQVGGGRDVPGKKQVKVTKLAAGRPYRLRVFPKRYRPVGQFVTTSPGDDDEPTEVTLFCPVIPERVQHPAFPLYKKLDKALHQVLDSSTLEGQGAPAGGVSAGEHLFSRLDDFQRAGLLNLFCKMRGTPIGDSTTWDFVTSLYRIRGDRIFANVTVDFRDRVKNAVAGGLFRKVDGALHKPAPGFESAGSFKTDDRYGNLQLTFFASIATPLSFQLDADIDDASGIEHAFQVIGNVFKGATHPYDIREILTFYQGFSVGYSLSV
jgi:hypothetical protein